MSARAFFYGSLLRIRCPVRVRSQNMACFDISPDNARQGQEIAQSVKMLSVARVERAAKRGEFQAQAAADGF